MAGISTAINLTDNITSVLTNINNALNMTIGAFYEIQDVSEATVDTSMFDSIRECTNAATIALQNMREEALNVPDIDIGVNTPDTWLQDVLPSEPVEIPVAWITPEAIDIFTDSGIERYQQEIQSVNMMMERLSDTQMQMQERAAALSFFPNNMISDITNINNRMINLQNTIQRIVNNPLNELGADRVNNEVERLRGQLNQAIIQQDSLNQAMDDMDISAANMAYDQLNSVIGNTERYIRDNVNAQGQFNDTIEQGIDKADGLIDKIRGAAGAFAGLLTIKTAFNYAADSFNNAVDGMTIDRQLNTVLQNVGAAQDAFESLSNKAYEIEVNTVYDKDSMIAGAAELATYINDTSAIEHMMGTLTNYAAGMSGGGAVGNQQMVEYATQLGKALDGTYDGLKKKGFELTEAQQKIIETGTDMQKALVIDDVINQSWANLAQNMANTPQGAIAQLQNMLNNIAGAVGTRLLPAVMTLVNNISGKMPQIESILTGFAKGVQLIIYFINGLIDAACTVYEVISSSWSLIAPVVYGIAAALAAYGAYLAITNGIELISNSIKAIAATAAYIHAAATKAEDLAARKATASQYGLNTALLACPLTWIIILITALIALVYIVVAAINKFADTSYSATGFIAGAFYWLGSVIANIFFGLLDIVFGIINHMVNPFIRFANFIGNLFVDPVSAIIYGFQGMADGILAMLQKIASAMDFIFGSHMADTVSSWRTGLKDMADEAVRNRGYDPKDFNHFNELDLSVKNTLGIDRFDNTDAFWKGYEKGQQIEESIKSFDPASLFNYEIPDAAEYLGTLPDIQDNTDSMKKSMDMSQEDLKYLRDIAERDVINRFTTAEIKVDFSSQNTVNSNMDLDGIVSYLEEKVTETLVSAAEGVHL